METLYGNWDLFCSKLEQVKLTCNGIEALCPAHDDKKAGLSAKLETDKIILTCHAGCSFDGIVNALGMNQSQFSTNNYRSKPTKKRVVASVLYQLY